MKPLLILACCIASLLSTAVLAAKVYTWKDENGVTHYGERPPKEANAKMVRARTGHSDSVAGEAAPSTGSEPVTAEQPPSMQQQLKDPERCEIARKNLETLNSNARIKMPDADGNTRFLTEDERQEKFDEMEKAIEESCE
ncbi:DUF4124 domain-containing protein [Cellvibrio japonicus]|nr:DUF4124 domain-containing protein [Cellvibrio japonicus]QEI11334.1 DUF4124 domain-containing protein [Cellvibrio japonicus]QEI14908.1 DUF4124 domain-containing protein [Cellvibrio japonicus]QEI18488.1 DUF4124 domain-containing protein [Cellvibrio japonicus]